MLGTSSTSGALAERISGCQCFQLTYQSLEGYANLLERKLEKHVAIADYRLQGCLFDTSGSSKQFIGRCHGSMNCGLVESLQSGAVICPIEQTAFFHSSQSEPSLLVVIELTATFLSGSEERCVSLGWAMLPAFHHQPGPRTTQGARGTRLPLYEGSPRALFSLQHPVTDSKDLVPIPGCILTCNLRPHPTLSKASHLIPANVLVSFEDVIPGLIPTRVHEAFPKLVRTTSAVLEKVSLLLLPSVDDFEEQLLSHLATDLFANRGDGETSSSAIIEERRVKVSLYNGWRFTSSPLIGYLEKVSPSSRTSLRRSAGFGTRNNLVLKGSLEISDIIPHPLTEVVLQLEYVVSWSGAAMATGSETTGTGSVRRASSASKVKPSSTHSCPLVLAWGVWQPWDSETTPPEEETQVSIDLKSGPGFKPSAIPHSAFKTCYQSGLSDAGKVTLKFVSQSSSRIQDSQVSTPLAQFEDPTPSPALGPRRPSRLVAQGGRDEPDTGEVPKRARRASEPPVKVRGTHPVSPPVPVISTPARGRGREEVSEDEGSLVPADHQPPVEVGPASHHPRTAVRGSHRISRSTLAYFHSAGFEEPRDSRGNPLPSAAEGVGPGESAAVLEQDPLRTGPFQVSVQLLAFSVPQSPRGDEARVPSSLILSYQFFQFPRVSVRCQLVGEAEGKTLPHLLRDGDSSGDRPGVMHRYPLSHVTLPTRTNRASLSHHLWQGSLLVDVSDGDSLTFLGTATVPLRGLLSQERDHFQLTLSSLVVFPESCLDSSTSTTIHLDSLEGCSSHTAGRLYLRLAKLPADNLNQHLPSPVKKSSGQIKLARRLYGYSSGGSAGGSGEDKHTKERKHARMQCVRETRLSQKTIDTALALDHTHNPLPTSSQMNLIDVQREELKRETIASVLEEALSSSYLLQPRMGQAVYFEHEFRNVHNCALSVSVSWRDPDLRLVTDRNECHYLRHLNSISKVIDDNLITEAPEGGRYGFLVHPNETVHIPFRYQSFSAVESTGSHQSDSSSVQTSSLGTEGGGKKCFKVYLQSPQRDLLGVLKVKVEPQGQPVDHTLHFYHPERTFLKRHLHLRATLSQHQSRSGVLDSDLDPPVLFACSSDPDNFCEIRDKGDSRAVYIKAPVKPAPTVHSFYIMVYRQKYAVSPAEVWRVFVHAVQRVDHSLMLGQSSLLKLTLRGNHSNRRVAFYSTTGPVLKVVTPSPLLVATHSLTELQVSLKPHAIGKSDIIISAVDVDSRQLVNVWLVHTTSQEPAISRAFQITLPTGGNSLTQKTIAFTNPYSKHKGFTFSTNQPSIITFNNCSVKLQPQETVGIGLQFSPSAQPLTADVLVFINDELDQTEECFLVKTVYSQL